MTDVLTFPTTSSTEPSIRPSERIRCLEQLTDNLAAGVLLQGDFDQRAQDALTARSDNELQQLTSDLR